MPQGAHPVKTASIRQLGFIRLDLDRERWFKFVARQHVSVRPPAFTWKARVRLISWLPWPYIAVTDAYQNETGSTRAQFLWLRLADATGSPEINQAALQRYLAEAVWYPTALLPQPGVTWSAIDDRHASVTLRSGATEANLAFAFDDEGRPIACTTPARWQIVSRELRATPWGGEVGDEVIIDGLRIPVECRVWWSVNGEKKIYFRARNTRIRYDSVLARFLPKYDIRELFSIRIAAPPAVVMQTALQFDLESLRLVRWLFAARSWLLGAKAGPKCAQGLFAEMEALGWRTLEEQPGRELVMGAVTQPWQARPEFEAVDPDRFAEYAEPGRVKIAWTLEAQPIGESATLFRTETRAVATDPNARRRFRRYWAVVGLGTVLIRLVALQALRRAVERRLKREGTLKDG